MYSLNAHDIQLWWLSIVDVRRKSCYLPLNQVSARALERTSEFWSDSTDKDMQLLLVFLRCETLGTAPFNALSRFFRISLIKKPVSSAVTRFKTNVNSTGIVSNGTDESRLMTLARNSAASMAGRFRSPSASRIAAVRALLSFNMSLKSNATRICSLSDTSPTNWQKQPDSQLTSWLCTTLLPKIR